ncbi:protein-tyrosine phosphatase-like protein [Mariannaea sp. PMI_226]|nr:protein-tyrosine phosphatase-like protein [Mariannaea sp. PMI_226]
MSDLGPPFIPISGVPNFRDLGRTPIATRPGHIIKPGLVFRAAEPSRVTEHGISSLQSLAITHVYDLRSTIEIRRQSTEIASWPGAERVFAPVFRDEDYGPEAIALRFMQYSGEGTSGFVDTYRSIWESGAESFGAILSHLAAPDASPLLVHCTAGKDRTGVICAIILSLCGVDDGTVAHEYSLTEVGLAERKPEILATLLKHEALRGNPEGAERLLGARPESMLAALEALRQDHGSVEQYVTTKCGISPEAIDQLRRNLIVADES